MLPVLPVAPMSVKVGLGYSIKKKLTSVNMLC